MKTINNDLDITIGNAAPIMAKLSDDFDSDDTANQARAKNGWLALMHYVNKAYGTPEPEPVEQGIRDLLGDLQHTCYSLGLDFSDLSERAERTFKDELDSPLG